VHNSRKVLALGAVHGAMAMAVCLHPVLHAFLPNTEAPARTVLHSRRAA